MFNSRSIRLYFVMITALLVAGCGDSEPIAGERYTQADMPGELAELVEIYEAYAQQWQIQDVREDWNPQKELRH